MIKPAVINTEHIKQLCNYYKIERETQVTTVCN